MKVESVHSAPAVRGACLCREVAYEIRGPLGPVSHCHCTMCRKAHGAAFGSYAPVAHADFRWLYGASRVSRFRSSSKVCRTFCGRCGSTLQFVPDSGETFSLAVATLDEDLALEVASEVWTSERVAWADAADAPAHYPENSPVRQGGS